MKIFHLVYLISIQGNVMMREGVTFFYRTAALQHSKWRGLGSDTKQHQFFYVMALRISHSAETYFQSWCELPLVRTL